MSLESRFRNLATWWEAETGGQSSISRKANHPAYQQIIELGPDVIPLMIEDMREQPNHWFVALRALTGVNPVPLESAGRMQAMRKAWVDWYDETLGGP